MRSRRWTTRQPIILMTSAAVLLGAEGWAHGQDALPGSNLDLRRAKEEARYIVVAEVGKTGGGIKSRDVSIMFWIELKPSTVLKGEVNGKELNRLPLSIAARGEERLPKTGEEFIFFIGDVGRGSPITKVVPKSEEHLAAIKAVMPAPIAKAENEGPNFVAPLGGGGLGGGGHLNLTPPPPLSYQGTKIVPDPGATGDMLKLQDDFVAVMSREDPRPESRQAHFAWLDQNEFLRREVYGVRRIGWYGGVLGCEPRPGGGWLVKVRMSPWVGSRSFRGTAVLDSVVETYEFIGGHVRLLDSDAATARPGLQSFPAAL